jgi:small subunit ribosomal protein S1
MAKMGGAMIELSPDTPLDESYWEALLESEETEGMPAPPVDSSEIWVSLGMTAPEETEVAEQISAPSLDEGWAAAIDAMDNESVLELSVVDYNRGGLLVDWYHHQGFVPASHLANLSPFLDEQQREQELRSLVGQPLCLKIIEVDPDRRRLVLSERATRSDENRRQELLDSLKVGEIRSGRVTNICSFGAFVNTDGIEGLVHISEMSWGRVNHPSDVLSPGQELEVYVLNIDRERGRVGLSIKRALPDPWKTLQERYEIDQMIQATITNVVDFGAFAQVEEGIEGLIHVSELAEGTVSHPRNVVSEGSSVWVRVISMDSEKRRLGLSLRQATHPDEQPLP